MSVLIKGITIHDLSKDAPTVDVVPVVRCKDCKWNKHGGSRHPLCVRGGMHLKSPDDHCSYGERKETKDEAQANRIYT